MYLYRLVVDANCINAKGVLSAMTALEEYHNAGSLELIVTSTLAVEFDKGSIQALKARRYQSIGAYNYYSPRASGPQSWYGAPVSDSVLPLLHRKLLRRKLIGKTPLQDERDCLHIDQAQMNGADIFITNEKRLQAEEPFLSRHGIHLSIWPPERALEHMRSYYRRAIGGHDLRLVKEAFENQGPIILGSNSCGGCSFIVAGTNETLATIRFEGGLFRIGGRFRDERGQLLVELKPGERPELPLTGVSLTQHGDGPILVADEATGSTVIASVSKTYLAVRMTHTGRAVVSEMELRDEAGRLAVEVQKENLVLQGATISS